MTLTWHTEPASSRTISNLGHVITGAKLSSGIVCYNAWQGEPHRSKHLGQYLGREGLQLCKCACERDVVSNIPPTSNGEATSK